MAKTTAMNTTENKDIYWVQVRLNGCVINPFELDDEVAMLVNPHTPARESKTIMDAFGNLTAVVDYDAVNIYRRHNYDDEIIRTLI